MIIDFKELGRSGDELENLAYELLQRIPDVTSIQRTGRGNDGGADLLADIKYRGPLGTARRACKAVIQCKHLAWSNRMVGQAMINPDAALRNHNADFYLLITTTGVAAFWTRSLKSDRPDGQLFAYWTGRDLEARLLQKRNRPLFKRYFPKSFLRFTKLDADQAPKLARAPMIGYPNGKSMPPPAMRMTRGRLRHQLDLICSSTKAVALSAAGFLGYCKTLAVEVNFLDLTWDSLISNRRARRRPDEDHAVVAVITGENYQEEALWIRIHEEFDADRLRLLLIEKRCYDITTMSELPCILLHSAEEATAAEFETFYRTVVQKWGATHAWFWCLRAMIAAHYTYSPSERH